MHPDVAAGAPRPGRGLLVPVVAIVVAVLLIGTIAIVLASRRDSAQSAPTTTSTVVRPSTTVTTIPRTTSTVTTVPPPPPLTELQRDWVYDPYKCGVDFGVNHPYPHSPTRTYEATATIGLWSSPTTASSLLVTIPVTSYGPGGIGCPDGAGPYVTVTCKITNGQTLSGPFGTYGMWLRSTYQGITGYAHDLWVDTEWDVNAIPTC